MSVVVAALGAVVLVVLGVIDIRDRVVPNRIVLPAAAVVLAAQCAFSSEKWVEWVAASLGTFLFLLLVHLAYPPGLGMGDVKLGLLLGALLGVRTPTAFLVGSLAIAVVGAVLLLARGRSARKVALPFAPFLAAGALVALLTASTPTHVSSWAATLVAVAAAGGGA